MNAQQRRQLAQARADDRHRARYWPEVDDDDDVGPDGVPGWVAVLAGLGLLVALLGYATGVEYLSRWLGQ